jgi:hypothetical protein
VLEPSASFLFLAKASCLAFRSSRYEKYERPRDRSDANYKTPPASLGLSRKPLPPSLLSNHFRKTSLNGLGGHRRELCHHSQSGNDYCPPCNTQPAQIYLWVLGLPFLCLRTLLCLREANAAEMTVGSYYLHQASLDGDATRKPRPRTRRHEL